MAPRVAVGMEEMMALEVRLEEGPLEVTMAAPTVEMVKADL